jgi:hypothetical protein
MKTNDNIPERGNAMGTKQRKRVAQQSGEVFCAHDCRNACALLNEAMKRESEMVKFYDQVLAECDYPDIHNFVRDLSEEKSKAILRIVQKVNEMQSRGQILDGVISSFDPAGS